MRIIGIDVSTRAVGLVALQWPCTFVCISDGLQCMPSACAPFAGKTLLHHTVCVSPASASGCPQELAYRSAAVALEMASPAMCRRGAAPACGALVVMEDCMKAFSGGKFHTQGLFVLAGMQGALQQALWNGGLHCHKAMPSRLRALAGVQGGRAGTAKEAARATVTAHWPHMQWPPSVPSAGAAAPLTAGDQADAAVAALAGAALLDDAAVCILATPQQATATLMAALPRSSTKHVQGGQAAVSAGVAWGQAQQSVAASVTGQGFRELTRHVHMLQPASSHSMPPYGLNTPPLEHVVPRLGGLRGGARAAAVHQALRAAVSGKSGTNPLAADAVQWLLPALPRALPSLYAQAWVAALCAEQGGVWASLPPRTLSSAAKRAVVALCG